MRISSTASLRRTRRTIASMAVAATVAGTAVATAGTASAATVTADNCTSVVGGRVGDTVLLDGAAVSELVRQGAEDARTIVVVHHLTIWPNHLARKIEKEQLELGTVPDRRTSVVDGAVIGAAVRDALDGKAGLGALRSTKETTLDTITERVAEACSLTVEATNPTKSSPSPHSPGTPTPDTGDGEGTRGDDAPTSGEDGPAESSPEGGLQTTGDSRAERRSYGDIPVAEAPGAGISVPEDLRYGPGSGLPDELTSPRYGVVGDDSGNSAHGGADVRDAGEADTLAATQDQRQAVQLPMLLAVIALAAVTAGLVRSWVLRRAV